jgi:hypothetical protein
MISRLDVDDDLGYGYAATENWRGFPMRRPAGGGVAGITLLPTYLVDI